MSFDKHKLPNFGLGLGLRRDLLDETLEFYASSKNSGLIEWLELVPENYILRGALLEARFKRVVASGLPLIPHGVNLSIGSAGWRDMNLMRELKSLFNEINPPWFSDHISCTYIDGIYTQDLIPVPFTTETATVISDNIKWLQDYFQLPFLLENPSYYTTIIEPEMSEAEFINSILTETDCGMLLDVNNVYVNSINHNYDASKFISSLDLDKVVQVHIAGHLEGYRSSLTGQEIAILDTHGEGIKTEVYDLLRYLLERTKVNAILLERDSNFPVFSDLVEELKIIYGIVKNLPERTSPPAAQKRDVSHVSAILRYAQNDKSTDLATLQLEIKNYWQGETTKLSKRAVNELSIYKSLVISSISDLLTSIYPLSKQLIEREGENWDNIVIRYLENYPSNSPVFNRAAEKFPELLSNYSPAWLSELAKYEWAELAVEIEPINSTNNFKLLQFKYPISSLVTDVGLRDIQAQPEQILVYWDPDTQHAKKLKLSTISALALTAMLEGFTNDEGIESLIEILGLSKSEDIEKLKQEYLSFKNFIISNNIAKAINYQSVAAA